MKGIFLKRSFDFTLSLIGIIISFPLWILFGSFILLQDGWPIFYFQERVGRKGRIFNSLKFRSMIKDAERGIGPVQAQEHDPRVTKIGKFLRSTAMDELPQLINILKGDMSFVGPRALRPEEIEIRNQRLEGEYSQLDDVERQIENGNYKIGLDSQRTFIDCNEAVSLKEIAGYEERQMVRPGLTGIAQIYLPTDAPRRQKFRYDLLYIKKQSFWLDLKLIFLSFWVTFRGKWESRQEKI